MKPKLEILTKINSLVLVVVLAIATLPTCKDGSESASSLEDKPVENPSTVNQKKQPAVLANIPAKSFLVK